MGAVHPGRASECASHTWKQYGIVRLRRLCSKLTTLAIADNIYVPKDRVTNKHKGHAFVEFKGEEDADYVRSLSLCARIGLLHVQILVSCTPGISALVL